MLRLLESEDWVDAGRSLGRLRAAAEVAGFRHLGALNDWHRLNGGAADFEARWATFVESLGP
jgi:hypothetical protein